MCVSKFWVYFYRSYFEYVIHLKLRNYYSIERIDFFSVQDLKDDTRSSRNKDCKNIIDLDTTSVLIQIPLYINLFRIFCDINFQIFNAFNQKQCVPVNFLF